MNRSKITVRYAKALFLLAKEKNVLDVIEEDMKLIFNVCQTVNEFILLLESPIITISKKQNIIHEIFKAKVHEISLSFLDLITKNKREIFIKDIARNFLDLFKKHKGIKTTVFTSAVKIDQSLRKHIIELVKKGFNTEVELIENTDEKLIGGFILRVDDQQFDASISTKLKKIKHNLINT